MLATSARQRRASAAYERIRPVRRRRQIRQSAAEPDGTLPQASHACPRAIFAANGRSFMGLMFIQANLCVPCTLLGFPTRQRFVDEIRIHRYDIIDISAILPNLWKARDMCRLIREHCGSTTIVVGGHPANAPNLDRRTGTDFETNGPSVLRMVRTRLQGWRRYKDHLDPRVRERVNWENRSISTIFAAAVWASRRWFRDKPIIRKQINGILREIYGEYGLRARFFASAVGPILGWLVRREDRRLRRGWTFEPPTIYEANHVNGRIIPLGVCPGESNTGSVAAQ